MTSLVGTAQLLRLILRRDRVVTPLWIAVLVLIPIATTGSYVSLFPTAAARQEFADTAGANAAFIALYGRLSGSSLGELVAWRAGFIPVVVALISLLTVIRHTRVEEETGRRELIGSTVVGRNAPLAAALIAAGVADVVLGVLIGLAGISQHLPAAGSFAFGAQFVVAGWVFAGVGAVAAQLAGSSGGARGIAVGVLGGSFLLRVLGDLGGHSSGSSHVPAAVSWLSPIGWAHRLRPYHSETWWPLLLAAVITCALAAVATGLAARRDVGSGLLPPRLGPATGGAGLRGPFALAWRLHRGLLAGWTSGFALTGFALGGVANSVGDLMNGNAAVKQIFLRLGGQAALIDAYLAGIMTLLGLIAAAYAVQATLRLRAEEISGRVEPLLGTAVSRLRWAASHLAFAVLGPTAALIAAGLTTGFTHGQNSDGVRREVPRILGAALVQLPAVWVLAGVAVAAFGVVPRHAVAVSWTVVAGCLFINLFGPPLQLDQRLLDISPFTHLPRLPGPGFSVPPPVALILVAALFAAVGMFGFRRRDTPIG